MTTSVECDIAERVATITLNGPQTRNALDPDSAHQLVKLCDEIDRDGEVGAVVVTGANGSFCSGAARNVLADAARDPAEARRFGAITAVYDAFIRVGNLAVPTVAAARGAAVGAGVNLLLAADLRVVSTDARIVAGFARIGLHPGGGHFALLGRLAGRETAAAIGLFGEEISGARARELGIAWADAPDEQVVPRAMELARRVAHDPELARHTVASFRSQLGPPRVSWLAAVAMERGLQMWSMRRHAGSDEA